MEEKKQQEISKYRKRYNLVEEELRNLKKDMSESEHKVKDLVNYLNFPINVRKYPLFSANKRM